MVKTCFGHRVFNCSYAAEIPVAKIENQRSRRNPTYFTDGVAKIPFQVVRVGGVGKFSVAKCGAVDVDVAGGASEPEKVAQSRWSMLPEASRQD